MSKKRREKAKKRRQKKTLVRRFESGPHTLEQAGTNVSWRVDVPEGELEAYRQKTVEWIESIPGTVDELRNKVREIVAPYDAFDVVANLWVANAPHDPNTYQESAETGLPSAAEYVALICLERASRAGDKPRDEPIDARVIDPVNEAVRDIFVSSQLYAHHRIMSAEGPDDPALREVRSRLSSREVFVQGPGFEFQERELLTALFSDELTQQALLRTAGFTGEDALRLTHALVEIGFGRFADRSSIARAFQAALVKEIDKPGSIEDDRLRELANAVRERPKQDRKKWLRSMSFGLAFLTLGDTMQVTADELAAATGIDGGRVQAFLDRLSVEFGHEEFPSAPAQILLLRGKPLISDQAGHYLVVSHQSLFWALRPTLEAALKEAGGKDWNRFSDARGDLVEERALAYLQAALPGSTAYPSVTYDLEEDGEVVRYEVDGLLLADTILFIVEGKGGSLTDPARRGAPERLKKHLKELIADAAAQANRTRAALREPSVTFRDSNGKELKLPREPTDVFPVVVTLEDLGSATTTIWELADAKLLPDGLPPPWAVGLYELELISDLVHYPAQFVHFLRRRARLNDLRRVIAFDELDWWMNYLYRGLYFDDVFEAEDAPDVVQLLSFTDDLDAYFLWARGDRTKPAKKPRQKLHGELHRLLSFLDENDFTGYLEAGAALLEPDEEGRRRLVKAFRKLRETTSKDGRYHDLTLLFNDDPSLGITFITGPGDDIGALSRRVSRYCQAKKHQTQLSRWVGFGWCSETRDLIDVLVVAVGEWEEDAELDELLTAMELAPSAPLEKSDAEPHAWDAVRERLSRAQKPPRSRQA